MGNDEDFCWDTEGLIPGDNSKPSDEQYVPNGPANLIAIPASLIPTSKDLGGDAV